jgi:XRE family aerobic/anaerobic benzoate catabolism transcriptional regulator
MHIMEILKELGKRIAAIRKEQNLTRSELAQRSGLSARFLAEVEAGRGNLALTRLADLCEALHVPLSVLISKLPSATKRNGTKGSVNGEVHAWILSQLNQCTSEQLAELSLWLATRLNCPKKGIALVGLRGAGKTTIGKKLAKQLRWDFIELDDLIEKAAGMTLQNIFEVHGEAYFRKLEYEVLIRFLSENEKFVLAAGGGMVTQEKTYASVRKHCVTIWLKADPEDHWNRVLHQDPRPITNYPNAMEQLQNLLKRRDPLYAQADLTVNTSAQSMHQSVKQILREIRDYFPAKVSPKKSSLFQVGRASSLATRKPSK